MRYIILFITILGLCNVTLAQKKITLDDVITNGTFRQKSVSGLRSMNDGLNYTVQEGNKIVKYSYKSGEKAGEIFDLEKVKNPPIQYFSSYQFSNDETKLLLFNNVRYIYRRSYTADYYVWNSVTEELTPLSTKGSQQVATFSPDGDRVAFVRDNNIFIKSLRFGTESQVTFDGKKNEIINGIPDWVYEEEFSFNKAIFWSPDSKLLAYIRFDETNVKGFTMTMFQGQSPSMKDNELYPSDFTLKYPKAGEANSLVSVHVFDVNTRTNIKVDLGEETNIYVPRLKWTADGSELGVMCLNRRQDELNLLLANPLTGDIRTFFTEKNKRYVDENFLDYFVFLPDNDYFIVNSERNGYSHLYLYNRQGFLVRQLTDGEFDVTAFYGFDNKKKVFYYQAAKESPLQREIYYVSLDGKKQGILSAEKGINNVNFSSEYQYFINYFSNSTTPNRVSLHSSDGKLLRVLEDNQDLKNTISQYSLPQKEFFTFKSQGDTELHGWILKPANFDPSKKYPVVMTQYSGPNSQSVSDSWSIGWNDHLASEGFIVACVDPRGTAARGEEFRKATYMQLGKLESDDQIAAARYLGSLPYVDKANIAIWGWSYGGFMSLLCMEKGGSIFKAGISVAPITHFKYYDTVYTERYMRTPKENPEGYEDNAPLNNPSGIKGKLLIVHGSADDNVHLQNTVEFTEAMVQAGVHFEMAIYTNRNHSINGGNTSKHLYEKMTDFLKENLLEN